MIIPIYLQRYIINLFFQINKKVIKNYSKSISLVCWEWFNVFSNNFNTVIDNPFDNCLNRYSNSKYSLIKSDNVEIMKLKGHHIGLDVLYLVCKKTRNTKLFLENDIMLLMDKCKQFKNLLKITTFQYSRTYNKLQPNYLKMLYCKHFNLDAKNPRNQFPNIKDFKKLVLSNFLGNTIPQLIMDYNNQNNFIVKKFKLLHSLNAFPFKQLIESNNRLLSSNINKMLLDTTTIENVYYILSSCPNIVNFKFNLCFIDLYYTLNRSSKKNGFINSNNNTNNNTNNNNNENNNNIKYEKCICKNSRKDKNFFNYLEFISRTLSTHKYLKKLQINHWCRGSRNQYEEIPPINFNDILLSSILKNKSIKYKSNNKNINNNF
ncbi:hypothetical protein ACTFIR_008510 [Dictyostelium discoideum]